MQVKLNKVFPLEGSIDDAWAILGNIEKVAGCMPGSEITEVVRLCDQSERKLTEADEKHRHEAARLQLTINRLQNTLR